MPNIQESNNDTLIIVLIYIDIKLILHQWMIGIRMLIVFSYYAIDKRTNFFMKFRKKNKKMMMSLSICMTQLYFSLSKYIIQDVHFTNYDNQDQFDISLQKWKQISSPTPNLPGKYQCALTAEYLISIDKISNNLQWHTPAPTIGPTRRAQPFYSISLEADFLLISGYDQTPDAKLILSFGSAGIAIFDLTQALQNASYTNKFGNLCQGLAFNFFSYSFATTFAFNSPVDMQLFSQGDQIDGIRALFSMKNLIIRYAYCHQSCDICSGPGIDQCTDCRYDTELSNGKCLCQDITTCNCPFNICGYIYENQEHDITQGKTYESFGFSSSLMTISNYIPYLGQQCLLFASKQAYSLKVSNTLQLQSYMIIVTYNIIIINPQGNFQLQFSYGQGNHIAILSYQESKYFLININSSTISQNIESRTDSLTLSVIFQKQGNQQDLQIQGNFLSRSTKWQLCSIQIREMACQANCDKCLTYYMCSQCSANFYLFKGNCMNLCPAGYKALPFSDVCTLDTLDYVVQSYRFITFMFFDLETTSQEAQDAFQITSGHQYYSAAHSVLAEDRIHARRVFGGLLTFSNIVFKKSFQISPYTPNYGALIQFKFYRGDSYENGIMGILVFDTDQEESLDLGTLVQISKQNFIGESLDETVYQYQYVKLKTIRTNIDISIQCTSIKPVNQAFCAISDFMILLLQCPELCSSCSSHSTCNDVPQRPQCRLGEQLSQDRVSCAQINIVGCMAAKDSICTTCDTNFSLINFSCVCNLGYYLSGQSCYKCDESCQTCNGPDAGNCTSCKDGQFIIQGQCKQCQEGFDVCSYYVCPSGSLLIGTYCYSTINAIQTNTLMYYIAVLGLQQLNIIMTLNVVNNNQFCGNSIIEGQEQCDDGNLILFDGCDIYCRYQCHQACLKCIEGHCTVCSHGWKVDNGLCSVIYNDGYIVLGYEECDDGNTIEYDGCNNGQNQCDKNCSTCSSGRCQNCLIGTQLNTQYICQSVCGDGIVFGNEQCDDGNDIQYDGCYTCLYQCQPQCINCQQGVCQICSSGYLYNQHCYDCILPCLKCDRFQCLTCQTGWYPIDNYCQTQCGDGIVMGDEECDSSKNCINCFYVLPNNCKIMIQGICKICSTGYQLNSSNECEAICGDWVIQSSEQCDDGNTNNFDGCSSECQTETAQSYEVPYMKLQQLMSNQPNIQLVQIQFSQQLFYNMNLSAQQLFNISVINQPISSYDIQINQIDRYFTYQVIITFQQTITKPVLFVQILYNLTNSNKMPLLERSKIIVIQSQHYYSQAELQNLSASSDTLKYFIYMIVSLCFLTYLLGKQEVFYNFLDVIQRCSYLQYINIGFPYSLQFFFQIFNNVSLNYVFGICGLSVQNISFPQQESFGTFAENNQNALLLANVFSTILLLGLLVVVSIIGSIIYSSILYGLTHNLLQKDIQMPRIKIFSIKTLWSTIRQIKMINFRQILNQCCYDNTISLMLQLNALNFNTDIYNIISLSLMVIIVIYLYYDFIRIWALLSQIFKKYQKNQMNINQTNIWSCQYQGMFYFKKIAFCINLVCVESNYNLQIIFFIILTLTNLVLVCILKPFKNKLEQSKLIIEESIMLIIYLLFLSIIDGLTPLTIEQQNHIAWLIIGLFISCMAILLLMDIYNMIFLEFRKPLTKLYYYFKLKIYPQGQN